MPTLFLSAATVDLEPWRDVLHGAFSRAGFRVLTQKHSLGAAPGTVKRLLTEHIDESDCVLHLAGLGYGWDADDPFPDAPHFVCSWTQFEYYYAHATGKDVIAFVCAPGLSSAGFAEEGDADLRARKAALQRQHRDRVASGLFDGTPLAGRAPRTLNEQVESVPMLLQAVAAAVGKLQKGKPVSQAVRHELDRPRLHQLPPRPNGFVGRTRELDQLRRLEPAGGAVITGLRGMGGIGKTALAVVLAHEWKDRFPDAQLFLDARGTHARPPSAAELLEQVIRAFHPEAKLPDDEGALKRMYHQALNGRRMLVVVDNARDAAQVKPLEPPAGCGLIVTSRRNFLLGKRAAFEVGRLSEPEATALLREFWPPLPDADAAALVRLCAGLPLALKLAGAHLQLDAAERGGNPDVSRYVGRLKGGRLAALDADAPDAGEVTISESLRLSEELLSPDDRDSWRKLGVFEASFEAEGAAAVAGADESRLEELVRRSLLERDGADRYRLHDLAVDYARAQLDAETQHATRLAHARHYSAVGAKAIDMYLAGKVVSGLALLDRARAQLEAAFAWLAVRTEPTTDRVLLDLVNGMGHIDDLRFHPWQRIAWEESRRDAARRLGDRLSERKALGNLGNAHENLGDTRQAIGYHEQALAIACEIADRRGEANALGNLGDAHAALGGVRRAIQYFEQELAIRHEIGDRRGEGNALGSLGLAHADLGDARRAIGYYEQALVISREIGDRRGEGSDLGNLGNAHADLGDARRAIGYYEQHLTIVCEIGDRRGEANALWNAALSHWNHGDRAEAISRAEAALRIYEAIESPHAPSVLATLDAWRTASP